MQIATLSAPIPAVGSHQPMPLLDTLGQSQANLGQYFVGSLLLSPGSLCTSFCLCPPRVYFPVRKFWQLCGDVNGNFLPRGLMPYPGLLRPEALSLWQSTANPYLHRRCSNMVLYQSLKIFYFVDIIFL